MKPSKSGIARVIDATRYSIQGLAATFQNEAAFRQELLLVAVLLAASFWLAADLIQWIVLVIPLFILLIVELLNSAVESAIDRIGNDPHHLSGRAKDMGSAAVLLSLLLIGTTWGAVAWIRFHG